MRDHKREGERKVKTLNIPVGISDFEKIRKNQYYYIDKTGLINSLLQNEPAEVTLITRPRRFGKTLAMSMVASFLDIRKKNQKLFEGLEISQNSKLCESWMNQWPVIFFSFKNVDGLSFNSAYGQLIFDIGSLFEEHSYLLNGKNISENERDIFERLKTRTAGEIEVSRSLQFLSQIMSRYYGKSTILLLDEYDVPLAKASSHDYYKQMLELMKTMMITSLKDNPALRFAVITGCLKISKESIFTGTNNFVSDTITAARFNEYFGFTQKDVDQLLIDADVSEKTEQVKVWYDGYHFGKTDVYCPWDVMNYLRDLQENPDAKPTGYWKNTSDNSIIRSFIDFAGSNITEKLETLLTGGYLTEHIDENLTYDYLHSSEENLWSVLYLTGYLTRVREVDLKEKPSDGVTALMIPNEEIKEIFQTTIRKWFDDNAKEWDRKPLFDAVWNGKSEEITREMTRLLRMTISYHDYKEDFYHAFLAGIFTGAGYVVQSNKEHGEGRSDVVVLDSRNGRVAVFEAKYSKTLGHMESDCEKAVRQINDRMYAEEFADNYDEVFCYGISFYKKRCIVLKK